MLVVVCRRNAKNGVMQFNKYFFLKQLSLKEIHDEMTAVLGHHNVSYSTVKKWVAHFKCNSSTDDEPRSGRPSTSVSDDNITKAEAIVQSDRRVTVRYVAKTVGVSYGSAETILTDALVVTYEQSVGQMDAENVNTRTEAKPRTCFERTSWTIPTWSSKIYFTTRYSGRNVDPQLRSWVKTTKYAVETCRVPTPEKFKVCTSAGKVMASVFWDSQGVTMVDYLKQGKPSLVTTTHLYYWSWEMHQR